MFLLKITNQKMLHLGYIPIDSIYTPIKNVKYTIENTRVEQRTDFEKLIMEVLPMVPFIRKKQ